MGFLAEFDAAAGPQAQAAVLIAWLRGRWPDMFEELRAHRPVLQTPLFTLVTRASDVLAALSRPSTFSVQANRATMDPSVGPFMLARDETPINWQEKGLMQALLRWDDLPRVRQLAGTVAGQALAGAATGSLDIVPAIARQVPLRVVQQIFGFTAPDADLLRWSFATQHGMFRNLPFDPGVLKRCHAAGVDMRAWLKPFLDGKRAQAPSGAEDTVSRLIDLAHAGAAGIADDRVTSNVCGLLVGAIETMSQAIVQIVDQFLLHPDWLAGALAADRAGDAAGFDGHVFEALRFNPITTVVFRHVEADAVIGAPPVLEVKQGTTLAIGSGSAMFDPGLMPDPKAFNPARPAKSYLHFGLGHHECLGKYVGEAAIPEAVRQILRLPGLRRAAGEAGHIDFAHGPFPEHMTIEWNKEARA